MTSGIRVEVLDQVVALAVQQVAEVVIPQEFLNVASCDEALVLAIDTTEPFVGLKVCQRRQLLSCRF